MTQAQAASSGGGPGHSLEHVVDAIAGLGKKQDKVTLADMQEEIGERSFGPFLFLPAVLEISPVGGIPGLPTLLGIIVSIFALQMLFGRKSFWMPQFLAKRGVSGEKLHAGLQKMRPAVRFMDRIVRPRMQWITRPPFTRLVAGVSIAAAACAPPLEVLPFASSVPFSAIGLLGLGLIAHDGLFTIAGMVVAIGAFMMVASVLLG
jgi:hypothetical protein